MEEKEKISADVTLNQIVADTMTRYNDLTENEFLEKLGVDIEKHPNLDEDKVTNIVLFNMFLAMQRRLLKLETDLNIICTYLDVKSKNEALKNSKKRGNKNGK